MNTLSCISPRCNDDRKSFFADALLTFVALLAVCLGLSGCGSTHTAPTAAQGGGFTGLFKGGQQPVSGTLVQLYQVGTANDASGAKALIATTVTTSDGTGQMNSNANLGNGNNTFPIGSFNISGDYTCDSPTSEVYIVGTGGNPGLGAGGNNPNLALMAALGQCQYLPGLYININELTTVASIAPLAPFMSGYATFGSGSGDATQLANAMAEVNEYANLPSGTVPGPALPSGYSASSTALTTLADIVAGCINTSGGVSGDKSPCGYLFLYATPPGGQAPTDTVGAIVNIQQNPTLNVSQIFGLLPGTPQYSPVIQASNPPTTWALPITDSAEAQLVFGVQPANTVAGATLTPAVTVTIQDGSGNVQTGATNAVTIAIGANPSNGTLSGMMTVNAIDGVATFNNLSIKTAGNGYTLVASASALTGATSNTFNITPGAPSKLGFSTIASTVPYGSTITPAPTVSIEDTYGNVITSSSASVTIAIGNNPASGTLSGTLTQPASSGVATFSNLSINNQGSNYTLAATSGSLTGTSNSFNVTGGAIGINSMTIGNNSYGNLSVSLPTNAVTSAAITLTSVDPTHFLLSPSASQVGTASMTLTVNPGSNSSSTPVYLQGQNYSGTTAIAAAITATATGFANGSGTQTLYPSGFGFGSANFSTTTQASSTQLLVQFISMTPATLAPYNYISLGPQAATVTYSVASGTTSVGTITGSPATFPLGTSNGQTIYFNPSAAGTSTLTLTEPTGYATPPSGSGFPLSITATVTAPTINVSNTVVGNNAIAGLSIGLQSPPTATDMFTISTNDPTHFLLSTSSSAVGTGSITVTVTAGNGFPTIYIEGQNLPSTAGATATITVTDSLGKYSTGTGTASLYPSGFGFGTANFSTTTQASSSQLLVQFISMAPGTLAPYNYITLGPQAAAVTYSVASGTTTVGTISGSPATFPLGTSNSQTVYFTPAGAGTSTLTLTEPTGYATPPSGYGFPLSITATVTAPTINVSNTVVGNNAIAGLSIGLQSPPTATDMFTISTNDPTHFLLSTSSSAVGTGSITVTVTAGNGFPTIYLEGQNLPSTAGATATITVTDSLGKYSTGTGTASLYPSGFGFGTANFSTTTQASSSPLLVQFISMTPGTLAPYNYISLGPQAAAVTYSVASGTTTVGTISGSPATFPLGTSNSQAVYFTPAGAGTSTLTLTEPTGYATPPSGYGFPLSITAIVTAPAINVSSNTVVGNNLVTGVGISLQTAPMTADTFTITSNDPTHFLLSTSTAAVGSASLTIPVSAGGGIPTIYIEGQNFNNNATSWTTTLTVTDSNGTYSMGSGTLTLDPSSIIFNGFNYISTSSTASPTNLGIALVVMSPDLSTAINYQILGPQYGGSLSVAVTSATTSVGTITGSPTTITLNNDSTSNISFQPVSDGTSVLTIVQPSGFSVSQATSFPASLTATVTN